MAKKQLSFEEAMKRLDEIVRGLEKGDVTLNDSMALFEEGTALIRRCTEMLDSAEQQVVRLKKGEDGAPVELPFDDTESMQ
jgi:exodeoxyribonuclease VII small subunit